MLFSNRDKAPADKPAGKEPPAKKAAAPVEESVPAPVEESMTQSAAPSTEAAPPGKAGKAAPAAPGKKEKGEQGSKANCPQFCDSLFLTFFCP